MWIDKNGKAHQPNRQWYSMRETLEIYADGGHVCLDLKEETPRQRTYREREEARRKKRDGRS